MGPGAADTRSLIDQFRFDGRVVLITGAGGSFGRAAATGFASLGASIVCLDIDETALAGTVAAVQAAGGIAYGTPTDVSDGDAVVDAFHALDATFGRVDVVLNLGGIHPPVGRPEIADLGAWEDVLRVNLTAKLRVSQEAAHRMIAAGRGGSIVNVSSIAGSTVLGRDLLAYGVGMAGVIQLTRELALAWAPHGIRVNAIQPCQFINASLRAILDDPARQSTVARMIGGIPLGRMGIASEIVGPLAFLASDAAAMVTGVALPVDGGNLAMNAGGTPASP